MSEEINDHPTPDTESFDVTAWLSKGDAGRGHETAVIYNDIGLVDEAADLHRQLAAAKDKQDAGQVEDLAVGEKSELADLQDRYDEVEAQVQAARAEVVITSLSPSEADRLTKAYKEAFGENANIDAEARGTFWRLAQSATLNGAELSADQWESVSETVAGGQWDTVVKKMVLAQTKRPRVDNPFSQGGSRQNRAARRA